MKKGMQISLLGHPRATEDGRLVDFPHKLFQLIAYLCLSPDKIASRETLAEMLWDRSSSENPRSNLRQLISRSRRRFPTINTALMAGVDNVQWEQGEVWVDVVDVFSKTGTDDLADMRWAAERLEANLLEGLASSTPVFEDWLLGRREWLLNTASILWQKILKDMTRYGRVNPEALREAADRFIALNPDNEDAYRAVAEICARCGQTALSQQYTRQLQRFTSTEARVASPRANIQSVPDSRMQFKPEGLRLARVAFTLPAGADGLQTTFVEEVANELSRFRSFTVIAPHSGFQIQHDGGVPLNTEKIQVDYTVSGFVRNGREGQELELRLVDCQNTSIVWAADFSIEASDLLSSSSILVRRIAAHLADALEQITVRHLKAQGKPSAYLHYLVGRRAQQHCDLPMLRRARNQFRSALRHDPFFAPACARVSETFFVEWILRGGTDPELLNSARKAAKKSISIDPGASIGHWMSGAVALYQRNYDDTLNHFEEAEVLNPHSADLLLEYADALSHLGQHDLAKKKFAASLNLNPVPPDRYWWFGASMAFGRLDFETAANLCSRIESDNVALALRSATFAMVGAFDKASFWAKRVAEELPEMCVDDFVRLTPDPPNSEKIKYYRQGLNMSGIY